MIDHRKQFGGQMIDHLKQFGGGMIASPVGAPYPARGPDVEGCLVTRRDGGRRDPGRGAPRGPKI